MEKEKKPIENNDLNLEELKTDCEDINEPSVLNELSVQNEPSVQNELSVQNEEEQSELLVQEESQEPELVEMESIVDVETEYNYRTFKYVNMYVIRVKRKSQLVALVLTIIMILAALFIYLSNKDNLWIAIIIGVVAFMTAFNALTEESKIDKSLNSFFSRNKPFTQKFQIDDERIRVSANVEGVERTNDYPWPYITEVHVIPEFIYLFLAGSAPLVLDTNKITKGTKEQLDLIIKDKASYKPYTVYNKSFFKNKNFEKVEK